MVKHPLGVHGVVDARYSGVLPRSWAPFTKKIFFRVRLAGAAAEVPTMHYLR